MPVGYFAAYLDRSGLSFMKPLAEVMPRQIMFDDGASHARLRGLCMAAFIPRKVEQLRTVIESTAYALLDEVLAAGEMEQA
jgi:cytochrome P450